jgi:hypothetical protein
MCDPCVPSVALCVIPASRRLKLLPTVNGLILTPPTVLRNTFHSREVFSSGQVPVFCSPNKITLGHTSTDGGAAFTTSKQLVFSSRVHATKVVQSIYMTLFRCSTEPVASRTHGCTR